MAGFGGGGFVGLANIYPGMVESEQKAAQADINRMRMEAQFAKLQQAQMLLPYREALMQRRLAGGGGRGGLDTPLPPLLQQPGAPAPPQYGGQRGAPPVPPQGWPSPGAPSVQPGAAQVSTMPTPFGPQPLSAPAMAGGLPPGGRAGTAPPSAAPAPPQSPAGGGTIDLEQARVARDRLNYWLAYESLSQRQRTQITKQRDSLNDLLGEGKGGRKAASTGRPASAQQLAREEAHEKTDAAIRKEIDAAREATESQALQMLQESGNTAAVKDFITTAQKEELKRLKATALGATPELRSTLMAEHSAYYGRLLAALKPSKQPKQTAPSVTSSAAAAPAVKPTVRFKAEYDQLPSGTAFLGEDGKEYTKP